MKRISDLDVLTATSNGDGTYSGVKLAQWLMEAMTGKTMTEAEARELVAQAQQTARAKTGR